MRLEWDARKARENLRKHGVSFEEASSVIFDPLSATDCSGGITQKRDFTCQNRENYRLESWPLWHFYFCFACLRGQMRRRPATIFC